jgi:hypothetical protein
MQLQKNSVKWDTATGSFHTDGVVTIENYHLPQFTRKRHITSSFHMFQKRPKDKYDFILGRDLLIELSIDIRYSTAQFVWENIIVDMVPRNYWTEQKIRNIAKTWNVNKREHNVEELHLAEILPADYKPFNINEVVQKQTHLSSDERKQLLQALKDFQEFFQGTPGKYTGRPIELELLPNTKPFYAKPFSIPKAYQQISKDEISRLENIGILTKVPSSEWAAPTFVIPKKNKTVRLITDFRGLNKCLKRSPYPMPKIPDIFKGMERFKYATTIDLNMGYYSMPLSEHLKKLCIICLPWGLYQYNVQPQGVKPATDIFQQRMGELFHDLSTTDSFMDDIIILGYGTFQMHLADVIEVLTRLRSVGMQVNPDKCMWFQTEVTYLGFVITRRDQASARENSRYSLYGATKIAERRPPLCWNDKFLSRSIPQTRRNACSINRSLWTKTEIYMGNETRASFPLHERNHCAGYYVDVPSV